MRTREEEQKIQEHLRQQRLRGLIIDAQIDLSRSIQALEAYYAETQQPEAYHILKALRERCYTVDDWPGVATSLDHLLLRLPARKGEDRG